MNNSDIEGAIKKRNIIIALVFLVILFVTKPTFYESRLIISKNHVESKHLISTNRNHIEVNDVQEIQIKGIDVSHFQGEIKWNEIDIANLGFVFVKATQGDHYEDPMFASNRDQLKNLGIKYGVYHFYDPKIDPIVQAKHYLSVVGEKHSLRPVIDIEVQGTLTIIKMQEDIKKWLDFIEKKVGCTPILYTYKSFWEKNFSTDFSRYPLWISEFSKKLTLPKGMDQWVFWQNSQNGRMDGIQGSVDTNVFFSNESALENYLCQENA